MTVCSYCGKYNSLGSTHCRECATELPPGTPAVEQPQSLPLSKLVDIEATAAAFTLADGFHRADWDIITNWIESNLPASEWNDAWNEAALLWVAHLRGDLGTSYAVYQSRQTILLCDQPSKTAGWLLEYSGRAADTIKNQLGQTAWHGAFGKDVVLVFSEQDDYYQYVAHHMKDGENPPSGGMCIHSGYTHIALPWTDEFEAANAIIHELAHDCVAHLSLPLWLNEGVAMTLERTIGDPPRPMGQSGQDALWGAAIGWRPPVMWDELAEKHFSFWTEENIQTFWAGTSFHIPRESNELSYSLAEVFVKLLTERGNSETFRGFLENSRADDAGHSAALRFYKADLSNIAGTFLGAGDWRPQRQAIKECWKTAGWNTD